MISRLKTFAMLVGFAASVWLLVVVLWGLAAGSKHIETPMVAVWVFISAIAAQLGLWLISKVVKRT